MRGDGKLCTLGGLYSKQFRRMTVSGMQKFDARGIKFYEHFREPVDNGIWTWKDAFVFVKQRSDNFSLSEARHFFTKSTKLIQLMPVSLLFPIAVYFRKMC